MKGTLVESRIFSKHDDHSVSDVSSENSLSDVWEELRNQDVNLLWSVLSPVCVWHHYLLLSVMLTLMTKHVYNVL